MKNLTVNTGLIVGERPTDYRFGSTSPIKHEVRNSLRDWRPFRSRDERQNMNPEDRMYCVTGSATNIWEQQANWMLANNLWPEDALKFWKDNGYIVDGKFEISRRFTAKMSKTTREGNYFWKVWDSIRKHKDGSGDGVVPDSLYPDDKSLSWDEYYQEPSDELKALGKESLKYFDLLYESISGISMAEMLRSQELAPLHFGVTTFCGWNSEVPVCGHAPNHAVDNDHIRDDHSYDIFDSYDPYSKHLPKGYTIPICYRAVLYPISQAQPIDVDSITSDLKFGDSGEEVIKLKKALARLGWHCSQPYSSLYDKETADVVFHFQLANISHTFLEMLFNLKGKVVGPKTRQAINQALIYRK